MSNEGALSFQWHQGNNGHWQRDIDEAESFYATLCRKREDPHIASFAITCHASFLFKVSNNHQSTDNLSQRVEDSMKDAWLALRHESPSIASWIQYDSETKAWKRVYAPLHDAKGPQALQNWLINTFKAAEAAPDGEWFNSSPPVHQLATLFIVKRSKEAREVKGEVYLRCSHDLIDGLGILSLLDRFFELASQSYREGGLDINFQGDEHTRLSPPLNAAVGIPNPLTDAHKQNFTDTLRENSRIQTERPLLGLPVSPRGSMANDGQIRRASFTLAEELTTSLIKLCKFNGVTITHLVSAAIMMGLRDMQSFPPESAVVRYCNQSLVNLRSLCRQREDQQSVGNFHMISPWSTAIDLASTRTHEYPEQMKDEMISIARQFREYFSSIRPSSTLDNDDLLALVPLTWDLFTPKASREAPPPSNIASVAISSLGNISTILKPAYGPCSVETAWVVGETLGNGVSTFIQTFAGKMNLSIVYHSGFHQKDRIEELRLGVLQFLTGVVQC